MTAKKALVHRWRFLKIYALKFCDIWQNFYFYRLLNNETLRVESREPLASFPFPPPTQAFLSSKDTLKCRPVVIVTQHIPSWRRSERQNDRSQLIFVLTQANANDKLCIRPFCTIFKHCCKLTSALRYRALFWRVQVINKRCRFHYVQWSYWSTWMMNASLIRGILFVVTRSLLSRSLKI